jgi:septin family protein
MKKNTVFINVILTVAILFSIVFQSLHSYEHHSEQLTIKKCVHKHSNNKTQIQHSHQSIENCFTCGFTFSFSTTTVPAFFEFSQNSKVVSVLFSYFQPHFSFYKGSSFSLRGPPQE